MVHTPYPLIVHHSSAIQVPVVMCRVFHRHVCGLISHPFRDPSSPKTLQNLVGSIRCSQTHTMRNSYIGMRQPFERITHDQLHGLLRHLWLLGFLGAFKLFHRIVLEEFILSSLLCPLVFNWLRVLWQHIPKANEKLTTWLFLGTFVGCPNFFMYPFILQGSGVDCQQHCMHPGIP